MEIFLRGDQIEVLNFGTWQGGYVVVENTMQSDSFILVRPADGQYLAGPRHRSEIRRPSACR